MEYPTRLLLLVMPVVMAVVPGRASESAPGSSHSTYVLVHGATGGGWDWRTVDRLLVADGHTVYRPTLTGLGEKVHLASPDINLTTHINDIVNVILFEDLHDVILVGHSYGGMVSAGVMDRIPERLSHVIFLDAAVPDDGQSMVSMRGPLPPEHKVVDGQIFFSWIKSDKAPPRDAPQPHKTYTELVSYRNPAAKLLPATYVAFVPRGESARPAQDDTWKRAKARGWTMRTLANDHNAQRSHPKKLGALLEDALKDRNQSR